MSFTEPSQIRRDARDAFRTAVAPVDALRNVIVVAGSFPVTFTSSVNGQRAVSTPSVDDEAASATPPSAVASTRIAVNSLTGRLS
jgi:hypothetical protein